MYASEAGDRELTFHVSGLLWNRSLVMRDLQTGSLWSHILGRCVYGELHQTELTVLPSALTDWGTWKKKYPKSTVMVESRTRLYFQNSYYHDKLEIFGAGMVLEEDKKIWSFAGLAKQPVLNDEFAGEKLVIWYEPKSAGAWAWKRDSKGLDQVLEFEWKDNRVVDKQTGSTWDMILGICTAGNLKGKRLEHMVLIPTFQKSWRTFHPKTEIWPKDDLYDPSKDIGEGGGAAVQ